MANRLANSTSPYLLAHAANPVDWWEWEEAAFEEARRRNLPAQLREALGDEDGAWAAEVFTVTEAGTYDPPALEPGDQPI